jgi:hypothetical protein
MAELKLDDGTWDLECAVLEHLAEVWDRPITASGSGAVPENTTYFESDDLVAFDRGIKSAERFGFEAPLERWRDLRERSAATSARRV